jgi:hypothetical protein
MKGRLADDLRLGCGEIAKEVLGADTKRNRRRIYHLHGIRALPTFLLGKQLALRPSALKEKIAESERERTTATTAE